MNKEILKKIIVESQEFIKNRQIVERDITLDDNLNYVFVGLRRTGK
jgi:predicted AAA+ superfamily ATPase